MGTLSFKKTLRREFSAGPVVGTRRFHCCDPGSALGWGTETPRATGHSQKTNKQTKTLCKTLGEPVSFLEPS